MMGARARAAAALADVIASGQTLDEALGARLDRLQARDRAFARELAFGVCRWYFELDGLLAQLLTRPLKARDADLRALILCGLYQLHRLRTPDHAAVGETVAACRELGKPWATKLVNAVLRGFQSRAGELLARLDANQRLAHPPWLAERICAAWPQRFGAILEANNSHPPMTLRVNLARTSRNEWSARARAAGIEGRGCALTEEGWTLTKPCDVLHVPGFAEGLVSVQDEAAQLAAALLVCAEGERVLDACAAPGGKTGHLLERYPGIELVAVDNSERRLARVAENLERLGLHARLALGDASSPGAWWDGRAFDRILLDAPCSGSGVIRRHPDIKLLRSPAQIEALRATQSAILDGVWHVLKPGGELLYCTCSLLPEENEELIAAFLSRTADARALGIDAGWGFARGDGRQLLPVIGGHDGFFYARLRRA